MPLRLPRYIAFLFCGYLLLNNVSFADTITFRGAITQSTSDGTGPAANNVSLNNVNDGDGYLVTLTFTGSIAAPGTYSLTGASLSFSDPSGPAIESTFSTISFTVSQGGGLDDISLLGCLTTGSGCLVGNELTANFQIAAASLNAQNVTATGLDQPHPLDLLEDDGGTDIHGSISSYSYTGAVNSVPDPESLWLLTGGMVAFAARNTRILTRRKTHE